MQRNCIIGNVIPLSDSKMIVKMQKTKTRTLVKWQKVSVLVF